MKKNNRTRAVDDSTEFMGLFIEAIRRKYKIDKWMIKAFQANMEFQFGLVWNKAKKDTVWHRIWEK